MAQMFSIKSLIHRLGEPQTMRRRVVHPTGWAVAFALLGPMVASGQGTSSPQKQSDASQDDPALRFRMPTVTVTAQKEEEDKQKVPVSVTAVSKDVLESADIHVVSEAAIFAPNTYFTEFSARKLSNARFRGIGASPNNPAITTYIDGVPQFNANSSSIELLDIDQIEFVRGPQSALFGRNTLGGLVNITSARPSVGKWTGSLSLPFGNHGSWGLRGGASGPVVRDKMSLGFSFAQVSRDGFTVNDVTGHDIDDRSAFSAKAQWMWTPNRVWETRVIFTGERARDGDYSLNDVGALRANPFHAARDFEGRVDRDIVGTTILARRIGERIVLTSNTGFLRWKTQDLTDLDYTPLPLLTRDNTERDFQFTQEVRVASADRASIRLSNGAQLRWQTGVALFTQAYKQDAINSYAPLVAAPFALSQHSPLSELDDFGLGVFGQGTITFRDRLDVIGGARVDYEDKSANLQSFFDPQIAPATVVDTDKSFSNVSPQVAVAYRLRQDKSVYASVGRGYKAGGFNAASPAGRESYGEERTWHYEGGLKTLWARGRVSTNAAVFYIDWNDLQLNIPNPAVPTQFFISNVGSAASKGVEFEVSGRAAPGIDAFGSFGYTHARFSAGSVSGVSNVGGNKIPNTPDYTASAGLQYSRAVGRATALARADVVFYGAFQYNDVNSLGQDAYSLVNLRLGFSGRFWRGELLVRNAFDTRYIPIAFPYPGFAPSGFIGEMGLPRTLTVTAGVQF
jgi:iron complex outermembrane receptor protein